MIILFKFLFIFFAFFVIKSREIHCRKMQSLHERTREGATVSEYMAERPRDHTEPDTLYLINSLVVTEAFMERSYYHSSRANTEFACFSRN